MATPGFILEAVPRIALDFAFLSEHHQNKNNPGEEAVAHDVSLQPAEPAVEVSRPFLPSGLRSMPPEIQAMIWAEKMQKPGLHFLTVQVPLKGGPNNNNDAGVRKIKLTEPCHKVIEVHAPYRSYFPKGMRSAYHEWAELSKTFPFARNAMEHALIAPLTIPAHNNMDITIDAATDLLYLKFHWKPKERGPSQYVPSPAYWMLILDHSDLKGIRRVAFEMPMIVDDCIFWPSDTDNVCGQCGHPKDEHDDDTSSELWLIADFLHCFEDLEAVYLVFNDIDQGPVDTRRDPAYTVSGRPDVKAVETDASRWDSSPDPVFRCDGGSLRELRGGHVVLPVAPVADTLQAYYVFHCKTAIGAVEAVSQRKKAERMPVKFKLATCTRD
jgi:hypothetical protein